MAKYPVGIEQEKAVLENNHEGSQLEGQTGLFVWKYNRDNRTVVLCKYYIIYTNHDNNDISYVKNRS